MAIDFSFPAWLRDQHSFADSLAKGAQVGAIIANNRYRNQALAAQAIQAEREYVLRERQLEAQERTDDLNFRLRSQLIQDQTADKAAISDWIQKRNELPLEERVGMSMPDLRLPQSYQIANQVSDNDRAIYERSLVGQSEAAKAKLLGAVPDLAQDYFEATDPDEKRDILRQIRQQAAQKEYAPSELEKSLNFMLGAGYISPEQAKALSIEKFLGPQESMEMTTDESGRPVVRIVKGRSAVGKDLSTPTGAFQTQLQQQLHSYDNSMALLDHIEKNMDASDFGLRGMAKELRSKVGGQFGLNVDPKDLDVRNSLKQLRQDLFKSLRSDSNITGDEKKSIERMLPEVEMFDVVESLPDAVGKLVTVKRTLQEKSRTAAQKLGVLPPLWTLSTDEIVNAVKAGQLNRDEAKQFLMQNR